MPEWFKDGRVISHEKPTVPIETDYVKVEHKIPKQINYHSKYNVTKSKENLPRY
jgi:ribosomal protein S17